MSAETEMLERAAAAEREQLAMYLDRLQDRLEKALDPRIVYERYPMAVLGAALLGGVILGAVTKGDGSPRHRQHLDGTRGFTGGFAKPRGGFQNIGGAVAGMVASRIADLVYEFATEKLSIREQKPKRSPSRPAPQQSAEFAAAEPHG